MLFALTVGPVAALLAFAGVALFGLFLGAALMGFIWYANHRPKTPATSASADSLSQTATLAAFVAQTEGLGVFKNLFNAIAANDRESLYREAQYLSRVVKDSGSFASTLERFVLSQVKLRLTDPTKKRSMLDFIGEVLAVDLNALVDQAKAAQPPATSTTSALPSVAPAVLLCLALLFGASAASAADPRGPQLHEPADRTAVIDPPTFPQETHRAGYAAPAGFKRLGNLTFDDHVWTRSAPPPPCSQCQLVQQPIGGPKPAAAATPPPIQTQTVTRYRVRWRPWRWR